MAFSKGKNSIAKNSQASYICRAKAGSLKPA
jgi:hypothetical protein